MEAHEEFIIRKYVTDRFRARYLAKKGIPRKDLWHALPSRLDMRRVLEFPNNLHTPSRWLPLIDRLVGRRTTAAILSDSLDTDGAHLCLEEIGYSVEGAILAWKGGEIAFYHTEAAPPRSYQYLMIADPELRAEAADDMETESARIRGRGNGK